MGSGMGGPRHGHWKLPPPSLANVTLIRSSNDSDRPDAIRGPSHTHRLPRVLGYDLTMLTYRLILLDIMRCVVVPSLCGQRMTQE